MFYYLYDYLLWLAGYNSVETIPEVIEVEEVEVINSTPHEFPSLNFTQPVNIAALETEQEIVEPSKKRRKH